MHHAIMNVLFFEIHASLLNKCRYPPETDAKTYMMNLISSLHKKMKFPLSVSSLNVTKSAVFCRVVVADFLMKNKTPKT